MYSGIPCHDVQCICVSVGDTASTEWLGWPEAISVSLYQTLPRWAWRTVYLGCLHWCTKILGQATQSFEISKVCTKRFPSLISNYAYCFCRGNCILIGSLGQPLKPMAQIALYIAGYELQSLDVSCESKFKESFRGLFRQTGLEGKALSIIITVSINFSYVNHNQTLIFSFFFIIKRCTLWWYIVSGRGTEFSNSSWHFEQCNGLWWATHPLYQWWDGGTTPGESLLEI